MRLAATISLFAVCSLSLTGLSVLPSTATGTAPTACSHSAPSITATDAQQLSRPTSATDPRPLGEAIAEGIGQAIRSLEPLTETGRPTSGLPYGLSQGVVGVVGSASAGYQVIVDPAAVDQARYSDAMARYVPAAGVRLVTLARSCRSAASIGAAWSAVNARTWHADAKKITFTADLDPASEQILVEYDRVATTAGNLTALRNVDQAIVRPVAGSPQRLSRFNDTPTGGHWGAARITSTVRNCTAGFSVVRRSTGARASVTAGHCGGAGTAWRAGSYPYGSTTVRSNYPEYDQALITGSSYGPKIWTDGGGDVEDVRTVKSAGDPAVGTQICQSGSYSASLCGITVQSVSASYCDAEGCTTYVVRGTKGGQAVVRGGDSGGPLYTKPGGDSATIRGMVFAGSGCNATACTTVYAERYASIAGHLGVYALTG